MASRTFRLDDTSYTLHLCDNHARMFDREIDGWARLARDVQPAGLFPEPAPRLGGDGGATEEIRAIQREAYRRARQERELATVAGEPVDVQQARAAAEVWVAQRQIQVLPDMWHLTEHARQRAEQRGLSEVEILEAVNRPEATYPSMSPVHRGTWIHRRGRCRAIVNRATGEILTVMDPSVRNDNDLTAAS